MRGTDKTYNMIANFNTQNTSLRTLPIIFCSNNQNASLSTLSIIFSPKSQGNHVMNRSNRKFK